MKHVLNLVRTRKSWFVVVMVLLSLVGGYFLARETNWSVLRNISIWLVGVLVVIAVTDTLVNALSTWVLLRGMGYPSDFGRLYLVVTASLSTNYLTPVKAGIPARLWLYKSVLGIPVTTGSASIVLETGLGMFIGAILSLGGVRFSMQRLDIGVNWFLVFAIFTLIVASLYVGTRLLGYPTKFLPSRYSDLIIDWGERFLASFKNISGSTLAIIIVMYLARVAARAFCLHMILRDMNTPSSVLDLVFVQSISGIVGILSMLPMGIGAKDASLVVLMTQIGVPQGVALVAALADRVLWTLIPLVVGVISINLLGMSELLLKGKSDTDMAEHCE